MKRIHELSKETENLMGVKTVLGRTTVERVSHMTYPLQEILLTEKQKNKGQRKV